MTAPPIRVLIADDHAVLRSGLRLLIEAQPDMAVVAEAADGEEAVEAVRVHEPDVALMDLGMPGGGAEAIQRVCAARPATRVLVLTMYDDVAYARASVAAGAAGYVVKMAADTELLTAIRSVHQGRTFVDVGRRASDIPLALPPGLAGAAPLRLSAREREVLSYLGQGHTNREIAERIGLSIKTVETYRQRLAQKLGVRRRADFVQYALKLGLVSLRTS
jgi:DNA-binding NarL/FixJ family response regulator